MRRKNAMSSSKMRMTFYMTQQDKAMIKKRASDVGRNMSDYLSEIVMWDSKFRVVEHARAGTLVEIGESAEYANVGNEK
jgi:hypothetical protein